MDELDKGGALGKFDPDGELMKKQMSAWDKAAYDALNPRTPPQLDRGGSDAYKDFDLSKKDPLDGTKIASATKDKLIKKMEDATSKGDTEALEKYLKQYKELDSEEKRGSGAGFDVNIDDLRQSGLPDGTQIAATYGKGSKKKDWESDFYKQIKDFEQNPAQDPFSRKGTGMGDRWKGSQVPQQNFGTLSSFYGGDGVDAGTLASVASQPQKKKKKTTTNLPSIPSLRRSSYKPKGSMIIEKRNLKSPNQFFNADDIKPDYPKDPPPDMVDGKWHPDLVDSSRKAERFNKLDPASAKAMPKTGDPNIDAKVEKAKNNPDKDGPEWHKKVTDKIKNRNA